MQLLGRYYSTINNTQRNSYFTAFYEYLLQIYGQILTFYNSKNYQIEPEKPINNSNLLTIIVMIFNKKEMKPINLDFQWRKNSINGNWQFYDMIIEGVSMIFIKQNEWSNLIRIKGIDELIK